MTPFNYGGDDVLTLSHSSLEGTFTSCERRFYISKLLNLRWRDSSLPGDAGNAIHAAGYELLRDQPIDAALWRLMLEYPAHFGTRAMQVRSLQACASAIHALNDHPFIRQHELATVDFDGDDSQGVAAIEVPFAMHLQNPDGSPVAIALPDGRQLTLVYIGYIDAILFDVYTQEYIVVDFKSTTTNLSDYTPQFQFDAQCMPYALVLQKMLGQPVDSLRIKYVVIYIDVCDARIQVLDFIKTERDIQDMIRQFAVTLHNIDFYARSGWWPKRSKSCVAYNRVCQYATNEMCASRDDSYLIDTFRLEHEAHIAQQAASNQPAQPARPPFHPWFRVDLQIHGMQASLETAT